MYLVIWINYLNLQSNLSENGVSEGMLYWGQACDSYDFYRTLRLFNETGYA